MKNDVTCKKENVYELYISYCKYANVRNPLVNVETNSPSIPCKFFAISLTGQDGRKRLQIIVLPLAAVCTEIKIFSTNLN